jgi:D-alanine-D-alanine ligase
MGGFSSEKDISIKSGEVIFNNIDRSKYNPFKVIVEKNRWYYKDKNQDSHNVCLDDFSITLDEGKINFDLAFIIIHGSPGEDGLIQSYLELKEIPYTGSNSYVSSLTFNKRDCISILSKYNIPSAKSIQLNFGESFSIENIISELGLPCFVKANRSGSSFGVFKVNKKEDLNDFIDKAFDFDNEILIESYLNGTEVSVGVMNYKDEIKVFGVTELITENDFFDYDAKYNGKSKEITPANISVKQQKLVSELSVKIYKKLGMRGFTRSEFIIVENEAYFLEINSIPGMTNKSIFPKQAKIQGISIKDLCNEMLSQALN